MGSLPRLKIKDELNYRKGSRDQALFARLAEEAAVQRRDMDQQILYSLEARQ